MSVGCLKLFAVNLIFVWRGPDLDALTLGLGTRGECSGGMEAKTAVAVAT